MFCCKRKKKLMRGVISIPILHRRKLRFRVLLIYSRPLPLIVEMLKLEWM